MAIVLKEKPYAAAAASTMWEGGACFNCLECDVENETLLQCSLCENAWYCNSECQRKDEAFHQIECNTYANCGVVAMNKLKNDVQIRLVARVLSRKLRDKGESDLDDLVVRFPVKTNRRRLNDLMDHEDQVPWYKDWVLFQETYREHSPLLSDVTEAEFRRAYGMVFINSFAPSFERPTSDLSVLGKALYLQASRFDHSCDPDMYAFNEGICMTFRLIDPTRVVQDVDPNKLTISYNCWDYVIPTAQERKTALALSYFFNCQCTLCLEEPSNDEMKCSSTTQQCPVCSDALIIRPNPLLQNPLHNGLEDRDEDTTDTGGEDAALYCAQCMDITNTFDWEEYEDTGYWRTFIRLEMVSGSKITYHYNQQFIEDLLQSSEELLNNKRNVFLIRTWEVYLERFDHNTKYRKQCISVSEKLLKSYEYYDVKASPIVVLTARLGELYKEIGDIHKSIHYFKYCLCLWLSTRTPQHRCVTALQQIINDLQQENE